MQYNFLKNGQIKLLSLILGGVIIVLLVFHIINSSKFHIVSTNPSTDSVSYMTPFFIINYNKALSSTVSISSSPNLIRNYTVNGKLIDISLSSMRVGGNYFIDIKSIATTNGEVIKDKIFKFSAKNISYYNLPKDQQKNIINNQDRYPSPINDPITAHLPYLTIDYTLSTGIVAGANGKPELVLEAAILLSQADMSHEATAIANYKQEVISYIKSLGLNPSNYVINYTITTP
ncbi:MAG TPA: hypothetical protein VMV24_01720 [Candidatus Dormibacteraeota bacterium]|nr:hypothetical protein [Candidatus Dormibacteraeota bacterium]